MSKFKFQNAGIAGKLLFIIFILIFASGAVFAEDDFFMGWLWQDGVVLVSYSVLGGIAGNVAGAIWNNFNTAVILNKPYATDSPFFSQEGMIGMGIGASAGFIVGIYGCYRYWTDQNVATEIPNGNTVLCRMSGINNLYPKKYGSVGFTLLKIKF